MRPIAFMTVYLLPLLLFLSMEWIERSAFLAWTVPVFTFGFIPILDIIVGKSHWNPDDAWEAEHKNRLDYKLVTWISVPIVGASIWFGLEAFLAAASTLEQVGWIMSVGTIGGVLAINIAHELIHQPSKFEQSLGGILLSLVTYQGFKVEHIRGHHLHVGTPKDPSTAARDKSVFAFIALAFRTNIPRAIRLETERLKLKKRGFWSIKNELLLYILLNLFFLIGSYWVAGWAGLIFFVGQSIIAIILLEMINYIEHYGLTRQELKPGVFEKVDYHHSWNSNYVLTNLFLFNLQRHSDHHVNARRRYQTLRHEERALQLPTGYAGMIWLALIPPLYFRFIDRILEEQLPEHSA